MIRILRLSLVALVLCALGNPAFAIMCKQCDELERCVFMPEPGTGCIQHIGFCETLNDPDCNSLAEQSTLADQLTVASVEVTTPNGVTKIAAASTR